MFCVWVENPLGMFSVGSFPLIAKKTGNQTDTERITDRRKEREILYHINKAYNKEHNMAGYKYKIGGTVWVEYQGYHIYSNP